VNSQRILNRVVDIYPDGVVVANGNSGGVYISRNFGKTWNKVLNRGRVNSITRLSDETFVYSLLGVTPNSERMLTTDMFHSNHRHKNTFWDTPLTADSTVDSDIFYVAKIESAKCVIYVMKRSDYNVDIKVQWIEQYEIDIPSIKYLNVVRRYDDDIVAITDASGITHEFDIKNETLVNQISTGSSYVISDGQKYITNLESNKILRHSLSFRDTESELIDYFPVGAAIRKVVRSGFDLYIFYDDNKCTIMKYNVENKKASLFFQLRNKVRFSGRPLKPGIPYPVLPETHIECEEDVLPPSTPTYVVTFSTVNAKSISVINKNTMEPIVNGSRVEKGTVITVTVVAGDNTDGTVIWKKNSQQDTIYNLVREYTINEFTNISVIFTIAVVAPPSFEVPVFPPPPGQEEYWTNKETPIGRRCAWYFDNRDKTDFYIYNYVQLDCFAQIVNGTAQDPDGNPFCDNFEGKTVHLVCPIGSASLPLEDEIYTPIGVYNRSSYYNRPFKGTFNGHGYKITGLKNLVPDLSNVGLFGCIEGAHILNVYMSNINITNAANRFIGGIVGRAEDSIVENCFVEDGSITGWDDVGGIVGHLRGGEERSIVRNCAVHNVRISGKLVEGINQADAGGIAGSTVNSIIEKCWVTGSVISEQWPSGIVSASDGYDYTSSGGPDLTTIIRNNVAMQEAIRSTLSASNRIVCYVPNDDANTRIKTINNKAWDGIGTNNTVVNGKVWYAKGNNDTDSWHYVVPSDGDDISTSTIKSGGGFGIFSNDYDPNSGLGWTVQSNMLPGLFGRPVGVPSYIH